MCCNIEHGVNKIKTDSSKNVLVKSKSVGEINNHFTVIDASAHKINRLQSNGYGNLSIVDNKGNTIWSFNENKNNLFSDAELVVEPDGWLFIYNTSKKIPSRKIVASYQLQPTIGMHKIKQLIHKKNHF